MKKSLFLSILTMLFIVSGCATYEPHNVNSSAPQLKNIDKKTTNVFLIGDAGHPNEDGSPPKTLGKLQNQFKKADENDLLLFLGDNIYPKGIPLKGKEAIKKAENALKVQLDVAKTFPGQVYFIPGNHDWYSGLKGLKLQEKMVEDALGKNTFQPENGCPIEKVKLNDNTILLLVDSHWYITNWNKHPTINEDCELKTRADFLDAFRGEIKKARGNTVLVAIHHPMFSEGPHNGRYSFKNHMKPLPVLGTIKNTVRTTSGLVNADLSNPFYNELRSNLVAAAQLNENVVFLSGHEHSLQYIESDNVVQIVSGSGSKITPIRMRNSNDYGNAAPGFAVLNISEQNALDVQFFNSDTEKIEFFKQIKEPDTPSNISYPKTASTFVSASIYGKEEVDKSGFYKLIWGERYRKYYGTSVSAPVVYLDTLKGGLTPFRKGGGTQSKSLHLKAPDGKRYVMRAMKKQADQFIQSAIFKTQYIGGQFDETASEDLIQDIFTGAHPYAPFTIGALSDAINVAHLNPRLFYMPKQDALGAFNDSFGDELYLFEEHASDGHLNLGTDNFTGEVVSTSDMVEEVLSDESKVIDEVEFIKARLFDMLIGDADRHQDQWRWLAYKEEGKTVYKPLPRDRDLAFSRMSDGALFGTAVKLLPLARKFRKYEPDLKDVKGFNFSGFPLDVAFITESNKSAWDEQVQFIQSRITDEVIDKAFANMPEEVNSQTIADIKKTLKSRRENLQLISDRYVSLVNKNPIIKATNKDDLILVKALENDAVEVTVFREKKNVEEPFYHKVYQAKSTKEIWIYGLEDEDNFEVQGKVSKIKIRLIGGQNNDNYKVEHGKNIVIYDYKSKKNDVTDAKKARIKLTDDYDTNVYDYRKTKNSVNQFIPLLGFNPDDGFKLGFTNVYTINGFERNPFTSQHKINGSFFFATSGFEVNYKGEFANIVIGDFNLGIESHFQSPNYSINFFGFGNETVNLDDNLGLDFNRVRAQMFTVKPQLVWNSKRGSDIYFNLDYSIHQIEDTESRFVENNTSLPDYLFDRVQFAGVSAKYMYSSYDNVAYPTNGLNFSFEAGYKNNLDISDRNFGYLISELGMARRLSSSGRLVLASKVKGHTNIGNGFEFFQAASIGGINGLRGFRNQRFTGKSAVFQNTDLRYSFSRIKTALAPLKLGIYGSFDYGRVWVQDDTSDTWHSTYGGGFFVNAVDLLTANLGAFNSTDGIRIAFGVNFGL